jgi:hypothetical protein
MRAGTSLHVTFDWPANFADGTPQALMIQGQPVHIVLDKISDI